MTYINIAREMSTFLYKNECLFFLHTRTITLIGLTFNKRLE